MMNPLGKIVENLFSTMYYIEKKKLCFSISAALRSDYAVFTHVYAILTHRLRIVLLVYAMFTLCLRIVYVVFMQMPNVYATFT
jgi:hypothetical protein